MATVRVPGGPGGARLAALVEEQNPGCAWRAVAGGIELSGPRIVQIQLCTTHDAALAKLS